MRFVQRGRWFALGVALIGTLIPTRAWAEGGLDAAFANAEMLLAEFLFALLGMAAAVVALRSRSRAAFWVALALAVGNGVAGVIGLATFRLVLPYILAPSLQVLLGLVVGPCLVVWRQAGSLSGEGAAARRRSRRWLVLWILAHTGAELLAGGALMPLVVWVAARGESVSPGHALSIDLIGGGLLNGVLLGSIQWLLLRDLLRVNASWIVLTMLGGALGGAALSSLPALPALNLPLSGAILAAAQWPALRTRLSHAWLWVLLGAVRGLLFVPVAGLLGQTRGGLVVFAWLLTAFTAVIGGLLLQRLARSRLD